MRRFGHGHVVIFAIRPYWRWQTQGTYFLRFNAIMNGMIWERGGRQQARSQKPEADRPVQLVFFLLLTSVSEPFWLLASDREECDLLP